MNVADQLTEAALKFPHKKSVVATSGKDSFGNYRYVHYTFIELEKKINQFANALKRSGVKKGDKTLLFVKPCLDFSALTFALFKIGAVPVFIDPGMGRAPFLNAIANVRPKVLIGIPKVMLLSKIFGKYFESVKIKFSYSPRNFFGIPSITKLSENESFDIDSEKMSETDLAAILFTSGGTGRPKGVVYTHDIFIGQTKALQNEYGLDETQTDVPGFPLFALFTLSMGMTSVIPDMDPSKPSKADPKALMKVIKDHGATFAAGSPAIWKNLALYCNENGLSLPTLRHLVMFGAPVPVELHELFKDALPNGDTYTPYGATESLPISNARGSEILSVFKDKINSGEGVYVGRPFGGVELKIIKPIAGPIEMLENAQEVSAMEVGEILVLSPTTTKQYYMMPDKTLEAKTVDANGKIWHRMGDMGYIDHEGNLWFCGRKAHVVNYNEASFYSAPVEAIFNQHPMVKRSALIHKNGKVSIAIERLDGKDMLTKKQARLFYRELFELGKSKPHTQAIDTFFLQKKFPVDVRHNIKIDRKKLSQMPLWALEDK